MRKVCVVSGSRAEYGLLRPVMELISKSSKLELQIIATGAHLSAEYGLTVGDIEADGFRVDRRVEMLMSSDTCVGVSKSMGLGLIGFADAIESLKPDLLLILGDRYEIFAAAIAALIARIPVAHVQGGEKTEGAFDEAIRHSITKISHLHFVAAEEYRNRVIQLGERSEMVFNVGALGVENISRTKLLDRSELEATLKFQLGQKNLLITFHPVTLEHNTAVVQLTEILSALQELKDISLLFTIPNADSESRLIIQMLNEFCLKNKNSKCFNSLGTVNYLSCIKHVDGVIGNSSSGLIEVPTFKKGTINIGDRQRGRLKAKSVINCEPKKAAILEAIDLLYSDKFQRELHHVTNPYGHGEVSRSIVTLLETIEFKHLLKKTFNDLDIRVP